MKPILRESVAPAPISSSLAEKEPSFNRTKDFICNPQYFNIVPPVPAGPFFRDVDLSHSFDEYAIYHMSTLEKNYVWKPHHVNVANCIDIVDQESLIVSEKSSAADSGIAPIVGLRPSRDNIATKQIHWLKKTTYLTNHLYDNVNKFKEGALEIQKGKEQKTIKEIRSSHDTFVQESIERSFVAVTQKSKQILENMPENRNRRTVEWISPVLPNELLWQSELSILNFDADPMAEVSEDADHRDILNSIVTNIRAVPNKADEVNKAAKYAVSLVSSQKEVTAEETSFAEEEEEEEVFDWVRDFRMEIKGVNISDTFIFSLENNAESDEPLFLYAPFHSQIELKRLSQEECSEHSAIVRRRPWSDGELEHSAKRIRADLRIEHE